MRPCEVLHASLVKPVEYENINFLYLSVLLMRYTINTLQYNTMQIHYTYAGKVRKCSRIFHHRAINSSN